METRSCDNCNNQYVNHKRCDLPFGVSCNSGKRWKERKVNEIRSKSYTLRGDNGEWLGQVVLTNDGLFASVTDYGNLSYAWRAYGNDFREFLCNINVQYFGSKLYTGMAYILYSKKCEKACERFAEKILPPLQKILKEELERGDVF